jgi:hypothetical protein
MKDHDEDPYDDRYPPKGADECRCCGEFIRADPDGEIVHCRDCIDDMETSVVDRLE